MSSSEFATGKRLSLPSCIAISRCVRVTQFKADVTTFSSLCSAMYPRTCRLSSSCCSGGLGCCMLRDAPRQEAGHHCGCRKLLLPQPWRQQVEPALQICLLCWIRGLLLQDPLPISRLLNFMLSILLGHLLLIGIVSGSLLLVRCNEAFLKSGSSKSEVMKPPDVDSAKHDTAFCSVTVSLQEAGRLLIYTYLDIYIYIYVYIGIDVDTHLHTYMCTYVYVNMSSL